MKNIVAVFTIVGVWVVLMAVAAVVTLLTYLGPILLLLGLFGAVGAVIVIAAVGARKSPRDQVPPASGYGYLAHQTYPAYSRPLYYPSPPPSAGWQGQGWWTPVGQPGPAGVEAEPASDAAGASPFAQRRHPSRFSGLAGGHR